MKRTKRNLNSMTVLMVLAVAVLCKARAVDRIPIDAKINGHPVHLAFDTGASGSILFRSTATRLGLKISKDDDKEPLPPGRLRLDVTEECNVTIGTLSEKGMFGVMDVPAYLRADIDGFIGWNSMSNCVVHLDFEGKIFEFSDDLPAEVKHWTKWKLVPISEVLLFESTKATEKARIGIDTGLQDGVRLSTKRWETWRGERAKQAATISADWSAADGVLVQEVLRARKYTLGGLALEEVPVTVMSASMDAGFDHADAVLGLFALKQLKVVIDVRNGVMYTSPIAHPFADYEYNRLGALFIPNNPDTDNDLVAHVIEGSPAYRAGIRTGDILLKIGKIDETKWRTESSDLRPSRFWSMPAGTKLKLTLKRNDQHYETTVTLEEVPAE
jgi:hypothetical protein